MSKVRIYILAAVAAAGIGLGGTFGASAVPINGNLVGATAPAPELQKVYYYHRYARRHYRRAYRRGYYGGYYGATTPATTVATTPATTVATTVVISNVVLVA